MDAMQGDVKGNAAVAALPDPVSETDELDAILDRAAMMSVEHGDDPDEFMSAARDAYLRANPELREHVERTNMLAQMEALRRLGILAQA